MSASVVFLVMSFALQLDSVRCYQHLQYILQLIADQVQAKCWDI